MSAGLEEQALVGIVMTTGTISNSATLRCVYNFVTVASDCNVLSSFPADTFHSMFVKGSLLFEQLRG